MIFQAETWGDTRRNTDRKMALFSFLQRLHVHPANIQISLRIRTVCSVFAVRSMDRYGLKPASCGKRDSDQPAHTRRLI